MISIVIPVYNTEQYLVECLESAINQTEDNIEIAGELNSLMREPILRALKEKCNINNLVKDKKIR